MFYDSKYNYMQSRRFRTSELTRLVPAPVRSALLASLRELKVVE